MLLRWPTLFGISSAICGAFMQIAEARYSSNLLTCLESIHGDSRSSLTTPSSTTYKTDRYGFNLIFNYKPSAIYHPATEADAAAAIQCAAAFNVAVAPRSGGHSYEAYCQGGKDGALVIDLDLLQRFELDSKTAIATVGAGTRLGPLFSRLWDVGKFLVPVGTCPSVGIGGHALGGGLGMTGRKYGMASDNVVGMRLITANGTILNVNATTQPDLFWALRGAGGGSFGLVTEFQIQAYKAPRKVTTVLINYPLTKYSEVLDAYADLAQTATEDLMAEMNLHAEGIEIQVNFLGPERRAQSAVDSLYQRIGSRPSSIKLHEGTWLEAATQWGWMRGGTLEDPVLGDARYARGRSLVYRKAMSREEKNTIYRYLRQQPEGSSAAYIIVDIWGGKIDKPNSASAFDNHRGVVLGIEFISEWGDPTSKPGLTCPDCLTWSTNFARDMQAAYSSGPLEAYQNYIDRDLPKSLHAYYGKNLPRLRQIKKAIDPGNVFTFPQAIPLPDTTAS
ncbi:hypothetical protein DFQ26_009916 [Actinomortierella ambigua]|nr:hypothetical protein DFQ26_009916 [Actinomortierella ambigua]